MMGGDRISRNSFGPMPPAALRLGEDLRRFKIDPEILLKVCSDQAQLDALTKIVRLAAFVESNADPLIMIDPLSRRVCYANAAATRKMPDLRENNIAHPLLRGWESVADEIRRGKSPPICNEVVFGMTTYERKGFFEPGQNVVQFTFSQVQKQKDLTGSAMMNPFPVIDYSISLDFVTFSNTAARKCFIGLGREHKILSGLKSAIEKVRNGSEKAVFDSVEISGKVYQRAIVYIAQSDILRIYAADATSVSRNWKVQLINFAAKMQTGFEASDIKGLEETASNILLSIRGEKVELGKLELDLNRLATMFRSINDSQIKPHEIKPHELESMRSVVTHFLETIHN